MLSGLVRAGMVLQISTSSLVESCLMISCKYGLEMNVIGEKKGQSQRPPIMEHDHILDSRLAYVPSVDLEEYIQTIMKIINPGCWWWAWPASPK